MTDDEFWIDPVEMDGHVATVRASFNEFSVTIEVERKDQDSIAETEAERAYMAIMSRWPWHLRAKDRH